MTTRATMTRVDRAIDVVDQAVMWQLRAGHASSAAANMECAANLFGDDPRAARVREAASLLRGGKRARAIEALEGLNGSREEPGAGAAAIATLEAQNARRARGLDALEGDERELRAPGPSYDGGSSTGVQNEVRATLELYRQHRAAARSEAPVDEDDDRGPEVPDLSGQSDPEVRRTLELFYRNGGY